jgi:hypothetical protein
MPAGEVKMNVGVPASGYSTLGRRIAWRSGRKGFRSPDAGLLNISSASPQMLLTTPGLELIPSQPARQPTRPPEVLCHALTFCLCFPSRRAEYE